MSTPDLVEARSSGAAGGPPPALGPPQQELWFTSLSNYPCRVRITDDSHSSSSALIEMSGDLCGYTTTRMEPVLDELLDAEPELVVVDLSRVMFIDGRGIRFLLGIQRHQAAAGGTMRLVSPAPCVRRLFRVLDLDDAFTIVTQRGVLECS